MTPSPANASDAAGRSRVWRTVWLLASVAAASYASLFVMAMRR